MDTGWDPSCKQDAPADNVLPGAQPIGCWVADTTLSKRSVTEEIWALAEVHDGLLSEVSKELVTEGKKLASKLGRTLCGVLVGHGTAQLVAQLAGFGVQKAYVADDPALASPAVDPFASVLTSAVSAYSPAMLLASNTGFGRDLAAKLACRWQVGLVTDCTHINVDNSGTVQVMRPVFGGKASASLVFTSAKPWLVTLRTGVVTIPRPGPARPIETVQIDIPADCMEFRTRSLEIIRADPTQIDLTEADVIVAGGKGVGGAENFRLIAELAEILGGKVGASRHAVDAGWISRYHQIGQSGKIVTPRLYIACGISGAVYHATGMRESKTIIAINKDPGAPIFKLADLGIVGDVLEVVPAMIEQLRNHGTMLGF